MLDKFLNTSAVAIQSFLNVPMDLLVSEPWSIQHSFGPHLCASRFEAAQIQKSGEGLRP